MIRTFAATPDGLIYDPASGRLHQSDRPVAAGRCRLDDAAVTAAAPAEPGRPSGQVPAMVCWSPLVRCNLACPHCLDDTSVPELLRPEHDRITGILAAAGLSGVDISGGEPLLMPDLPALADRITAPGLTAVSITTNGWHLARRATELLGAIDAIRVSLDGPDAARHDNWRGAGSFDRAVHGIRTARDIGLPVQLQTVLMVSTYGWAQPIVDLAAGFGVTGVTFLQMLPIGTGAELAGREALPDDAARRTVDALRVPAGLPVWLRERRAAAGFTVVRADGRVWRNDTAATSIAVQRPLCSVDDLTIRGGLR